MLGYFGFWFHAENMPSLKNQNVAKNGYVVLYFVYIGISIGAVYMSLYLSGTIFRTKIGYNLPLQNRS